MKLFITFVLGALTGVCVLWFGFSKALMTVNDRLVVVDRFTGRASRVFISIQESEIATAKEFAQIEALEKNPDPEIQPKAAPEPEKPAWRELSESEVKRLEFEWHIDKYRNGGTVVLKYHNPFEQAVRIEKVRIQIPAKNGHAAVDREYETMKDFCPPQADTETVLYSLKIPVDEFYELTATTETSQSSGPDPFGVAPSSTSQKQTRRLVGIVIPARTVIQQ